MERHGRDLEPEADKHQEKRRRPGKVAREPLGRLAGRGQSRANPLELGRSCQSVE